MMTFDEGLLANLDEVLPLTFNIRGEKQIYDWCVVN